MYMQRVQIYLPDKLVKQTKAQAKRKKVSWAQYLRELLSEQLQTQPKTNPLLQLAGKYPGTGDSKAASKHNDIYKI
jgi:metal-responsive CopG/Arc/MetJ family transcriptional regulator